MRSDAGVRVAIVGAGFSGTMLAVHLRRLGAAVTLIDRTGRFAEGLAYSTPEPVHLLNVRAGNMSAFAEEPNHFADWLAAHGEGDRSTFAPRCSYRRYLAEILGQARVGMECLEEEVLSLDGGTLRLASGARITADAVVVASGNLPPAGFDALPAAGLPFVGDPWSAEGRDGLADLARRQADVLLLGTGLTMVDTVLSLEAHGFRGRAVALSRRGQLPEPHAAFDAADVAPPSATSPRDLLRWARREAETHDWRAVVDSLRPCTASIWRSWSLDQRGRFLRHLRPWWDVRRHRIAPQVWDRLQTLIAQGRLQIRAGRIAGAGKGQIAVRYRGQDAIEAIEVAGAVNCTGPRGDIRRSGDRLIGGLLRGGQVQADGLGLGLDVDQSGRLLGADGNVAPGLYAIGPMTRGAFWEIVAVPDIRVQALALAGTIVADAALASRSAPWQAAAAAR